MRKFSKNIKHAPKIMFYGLSASFIFINKVAYEYRTNSTVFVCRCLIIGNTTHKNEETLYKCNLLF